MIINWLKTPSAGARFDALPILEYDYSSAGMIELDDTSTPTSELPAGAYRIQTDVDCYYTIGADPIADPAEANSFFLPAGADWHEIVADGMKLAAILKNPGDEGTLRFVAAATVEVSA